MEYTIAEMLTDRKLIKKSLVLPFRYISAISEVEKSMELLRLNKIISEQKKILKEQKNPNAILCSIYPPGPLPWAAIDGCIFPIYR